MDKPYIGQKVKLYILEKKKDIETEVTEVIKLEGKILVKLKSGALVSYDIVKEIQNENTNNTEKQEKDNNG